VESPNTESGDDMEPVDIDAIKSELELTFTNIYCYFNMLQAISDDNDVDHHRFVKFIQQVGLKCGWVLLVDSLSSKAKIWVLFSVA